MKNLTLVFAFTLFAQSSAHAWPWDKWYTENDVQYGKTESERADLYFQKSGADNPALVIVHGGGWVAGDKSTHKYYAEKFADKGISVMSINYRLAGVAPWPAQIQDVQLAVRWLKSVAGSRGIDPRRICVLGDSAGGHLALMLGSLQKSWPGDRSDLYADQSPTVNCVVDMFGPTDLANPNFNKDGKILVGLFGGKTVKDDPAAYAKASPIKIASAKTSRTLIVHGTTDNIVPIAQATDFAEVLKGLSVRHQVIAFNGGHWFADLKPSSQKTSIENYMIEWVRQILNP